MSRLPLIAFLAALAACSRPGPPAPPAGDALPAATPTVVVEAVSADSPAVQVQAAVEEALGQPPLVIEQALDPILPDAPPPPTAPLVAPEAVDLIIAFEIVSEGYYNKRLWHPVWPGGASGVTWCIGYDGGHQTHSTILREWAEHAQRERLAQTSGITGATAKSVLPKFIDIRTAFPLCEQVFSISTLVEYHRRAQRVFADGWDTLHPLAQGALVSLVYNRGASTTGDSRREMKAIAKECVPNTDYDCIAAQILAMRRLWRGSSIEAGMNRRREAEAALVRQAGA